MKRTIIYSVLICLVLITPFTYSDDLYNGLISAKQIWFYGAMSLLIMAFSIELLLHRRNNLLSFNIIDIALLAFYTYFFIRAITTPYMPMLQNQRFLNWSLLVVLYFIVKRLSWSFNSHSMIKQKNNNRMTCEMQLKSKGQMTHEVRMTTNNKINFFIIHFLIITGLIEAIWGLLQLYGLTRSFHSGFKITGTFFNPAPYALYLAVIFPIALGTLFRIKELKINNRMTAQPNDARSANDNRMTVQPMTLRVTRFFSSDSKFLHSLIPSFLHYLTPTLLIHKLTYYVSLFTVIAIILVLPATMNRASWLGVVAGSLVVFNYRYNLLKQAKVFLHNPVRKLLALALIFIIIGVTSLGLYLLKKGSSDGRLLIWEITTGKISEKLFFGHGVGRFEAEYNNWQADYFKTHPEAMNGSKGMVAGNTKYCFNEHLEMAAELGIIGLLLFLFLIVSVFSGIYEAPSAINDKRMTTKPSDARSANDALRAKDNRMTAQQMTPEEQMMDAGQMTPEAQRTFIILIPSLISLLVCASISFPFYSLPTLILFFISLAILSSQIKEIHLSERLSALHFIGSLTREAAHQILTPFIRRSSGKVGFLTLFTFSTLSVISILLLFMTRQQYKAYYKLNEAVMLYKGGNYGEACNSFSGSYFPMRYSGTYMQYYGKSLSMNEKYSQSVEILERSALYTSDEILYTTLGDTYKGLKRYGEADEAYQHALFMVPHKLYPRYLLANLYSETGQKEKALNIAEEILSREIKVESTAIEEMKQGMRELIKSIKK